MRNFTKMKSWLMLVILGLTFSLSSAFAQEISVTGTDLGDIPEGTIWLEAQTITITAEADLEITEIAFDESNEYFSIEGMESDLPVYLEDGETFEVYVNCSFPDLDPNVDYEKNLIVAFGLDKDFETFPVYASSYNAKQGDVVENAISFTPTLNSAPEAVPAPSVPGGTTNKNYNTPSSNMVGGNVKDRVWKIEAAQDMHFGIGMVTAGKVAFDYAVAIYDADDFEGDGPMADNALVSEYNMPVALQMWEGDTYYVVATYDFDVMGQPQTFLDYVANTMTAPTAVLKVSPADESTDIVNGDMLEWQYTDSQVQEYRVLLSTEIPLDPNTDVFVDWTEATRYEQDVVTSAPIGDEATLTGLDNNQIYFWRVDVRNNEGETIDPNSWGFTSALNVPLEVTANGVGVAEMFEGDDVTVSWEDPNAAKAFLGYNVYVDGVLENTSGLVSDVEYVISGLTYNMTGYPSTTGGYQITVTAVYDEGESDPSDPVAVYVSGYGDIDGQVTDFTTGNPIAGATVDYDGTDEFGNSVSGSVTTNASGVYMITGTELGEYDLDFSATGYVGDDLMGLVLAFGSDLEDQDIALVEEAYPPTNVVATPAGADVNVTWDDPAMKALVDYDAERELYIYEPGTTPTIHTTVGYTTGNEILDDTYADQTDAGIYMWRVRANYDDTQSVWAYSNHIDKDMEADVDVTVTTEFGDDPTAEVTFEYVGQEIGEDWYTAGMYDFGSTLDATGMASYNGIRKGTYDWEVSLDGYVSQSGTIVIWEDKDLNFDLMGGTPPPQNLMADNVELYLGEDVTLTWEPSASSQFQGYVLYRDGVAILGDNVTPIPVTDLTFTDVAPAYNMAPGHEYWVTAWYDGVESAPSNSVFVEVTGEGAVAGTVVNAMDDSPLKDVIVRFVGLDEFGAEAIYEFTTDADGEFTSITGLINDGVLAGTYDVTFTKENYATVSYTDVDVNYNAVTLFDEVMFPGMTVTAVELDADNVQLTWEFDAVDKEIQEYQIYRAEWDVENPSFGEFMGVSYGQIFIDDSWGDFDWGAYHWAVVAIFDDGATYAWSNVLTKDIETSATVTVTLNSLESPEGTEVKLTYDGFTAMEYETTLDATGSFTFDPIYKGTYAVKVSKFGYETIFDLVDIVEPADLTYELIEMINPVSNLYVNPNGYATWEVEQPAALEMYANDFVTEPTDIEITYAGTDAGENGNWFWSSFSENMKSGWSSSSGHNDTRMTFPKVIVTDQTVVEFAFYFSGSLDDTELYLDASNNDGNTWTTIRLKDFPISASTWYVFSTDVVDELGFAADDEITVRLRKTDDYGWYVYVDDVFVGDAPADKGLVATNLVGTSNGSKDNFSENVPEFTYETLAKQSETIASKSLETFKVYLDNTFAGDTENMYWDYETDGPITLVEGETYTARVDAEYTTGTSESMYYTFTYHACDFYNSVSDLTATRVIGTTDIALTWTNDEDAVSGDDFAGTVIYRDGEWVATVDAGVTTYTDGNLDAGVYTYCLTQIYDSEAESCEVCATEEMTLGGFVNGFVTEFDGDNAPIEGATVAIVGAESFIFTTDATGYYEGEVLDGTYTYTVSMDGYQSEVEAGVVVDYGATVVKDFALMEYPYAVGYVLAEEQSDATVLVTWGGESNPPIGDWLTYDDGVNWNALGNSVSLTMSWANRFEPAQLTQFPDCAVTEIEAYIGAEANTTIYARVWAGAEAATLLYEEDVTDQVSWDDWNTFTLAEPVPFDNTQELWIGFYGEDAGASFPAGLSNTAAPNANGDLYNSGSGWLHASNLGAGDLVFNLSGYVTNQVGDKVAIGGVKDMTNYKEVGAPTVIAADAPTYKPVQTYAGATKELVGYQVWRGIKDGEGATDLQLLGTTMDESFADNTWGAADWGVYRWAVVAVYDYNESVPVFSNALDKDMNIVLTLEVSTSSGDSPGGAEATLVNVSEEGFDDIVTLIPGNGIRTIDPFRRGHYDVTVTKTGFIPVELTDVVIEEDMTLEILLVENLLAPSDLYVTPTGYATWSGTGVVPFTPFEDNLDTQDQFDMWEIIDGPSTADTWFWSNGSNNQYGETLDGTGFAMVDSDDAGIGTTMDELMVSPIFDATNAGVLYIEFDQYYNNISSSELADVEVFDGTDWVTVLHQAEDHGAWGAPDHVVIDVTEYANAMFQFRFHYLAPGWDWHWAIDNIMLHNNAPANKAVEDFLVYHDGTYVASTVEEMYQYGDNEEVLVPGETYLAEVATVYTTGISDKASYEWTYIPCEDFDNYNSMLAENIEGTFDMEVMWSYMASPMELITINQGYGAPSNGYFQQFGYGYGVAYDFAAYPDALVNSVNFRHSSWGTVGTWDYMIHIFDWDTQTLIESVGPFQSTVNDDWEMGVELGDVSTGGASTVAILMEPMGNSATDAYPCLDSDSEADPQGSIFGDLATPSAIGASGIGNFLMDVSIYTANAGAKSQPVVITSNATPEATPRVAVNNTVNLEQVITQNVNKSKEFEVLGVNLYRDGEMIAFVPSPDTVYVDMDLAPGYYDYCVESVYTEDGGLHSWTTCSDLCFEDALIPEECAAPENLVAEDQLNDGYTATLYWGTQFDPVWLQYDDGVNVDAIGGPTEFSYACKWDPAQLTGFDGTAVTKVNFFPREAGSSFTLRIWQGTNAANLVYEQPLSGLTFDAWNEVTLNTPAPIDPEQELWIGFYVLTGGYPAGCGATTGAANGDYVTLDGVLWEHLSDYGLPYTWNLAAYVEGAKGQIQLPAITDNATYNNNNAEGLAAGNLPVIEDQVAPNAPSEFLSYNVYRDGELIATDVMENTYVDEVGVPGLVCYTVTAVYEFCGESAHSNEACVDLGVGINELENSIAVYPNPATDFVMVESTQDIRSIEITNYMGQVVNSVKAVENTQYRINTSELSAGVYFVEVETAAGIEKVRVVISE